MLSELILGSEVFGCTIDPAQGARLSSLRMAGLECLVGPTPGVATTDWGAFPMVPYAGRVRDGRFTHEGHLYQLPRTAGPHAIHGTVLNVAWKVLEHSSTHAVLETGLGPHWPFPGTVCHRVSVDPLASTVTCVLRVSTTARSMPAMVGWHPWFRRPAALELDFTELYERDAGYIPTGKRIPPPPGPWDDCFTGARRPPVVILEEGVRVVLESDCDHWVVYDQPEHALCLEPQSGPPDAFTLAPQRITPEQPLERTLILRCLLHPNV